MSCEIFSISFRIVEPRSEALPLQQNGGGRSCSLGIAMSESTLSQTADTTTAKKKWYVPLTSCLASLKKCLLKIFHACTCNCFKQENRVSLATARVNADRARTRLDAAEGALEAYFAEHPDLRPLVTAYRQAQDATRQPVAPADLNSAFNAFYVHENASRLAAEIRAAEAAVYRGQQAVATAQANPSQVTTPGEVPANVAQTQQTLQTRRNELATAEQNLAANAEATRLHQAVESHPLRRAAREAERRIFEHAELGVLHYEVTLAQYELGCTLASFANATLRDSIAQRRLI